MPDERRPVVVVMGVEGVGKSTVGRRLADELGVEFVEGDDEHSPAAKAQMAAGIPLDDERSSGGMRTPASSWPARR